MLLLQFFGEGLLTLFGEAGGVLAGFLDLFCPWPVHADRKVFVVRQVEVDGKLVVFFAVQFVFERGGQFFLFRTHGSNLFFKQGARLLVVWGEGNGDGVVFVVDEFGEQLELAVFDAGFMDRQRGDGEVNGYGRGDARGGADGSGDIKRGEQGLVRAKGGGHGANEFGQIAFVDDAELHAVVCPHGLLERGDAGLIGELPEVVKRTVQVEIKTRNLGDLHLVGFYFHDGRQFARVDRLVDVAHGEVSIVIRRGLFFGGGAARE